MTRTIKSRLTFWIDDRPQIMAIIHLRGPP
jgi:hypothetical protein